MRAKIYYKKTIDKNIQIIKLEGFFKGEDIKKLYGAEVYRLWNKTSQRMYINESDELRIYGDNLCLDFYGYYEGIVTTEADFQRVVKAAKSAGAELSRIIRDVREYDLEVAKAIEI